MEMSYIDKEVARTHSLLCVDPCHIERSAVVVGWHGNSPDLFGVSPARDEEMSQPTPPAASTNLETYAGAKALAMEIPGHKMELKPSS